MESKETYLNSACIEYRVEHNNEYLLSRIKRKNKDNSHIHDEMKKQNEILRELRNEYVFGYNLEEINGHGSLLRETKLKLEKFLLSKTPELRNAFDINDHIVVNNKKCKKLYKKNVKVLSILPQYSGFKELTIIYYWYIVICENNFYFINENNI